MLPPEDVGRTLDGDAGTVWIDFGHDEHDGERLLTDLLQARPEDVEDCHSRMPVPTLNAYRDHYFSAINGHSWWAAQVPGPSSRPDAQA